MAHYLLNISHQTVQIEAYGPAPSAFTPLESPAACSGDEGNFLMGANAGINAPCEPSR